MKEHEILGITYEAIFIDREEKVIEKFYKEILNLGDTAELFSYSRAIDILRIMKNIKEEYKIKDIFRFLKEKRIRDEVDIEVMDEVRKCHKQK